VSKYNKNKGVLKHCCKLWQEDHSNIDVQQWQLNEDMMIDANIAITLLEKRPEKNFIF